MKHLLITTIAAVLVVGCGGLNIWEAAEQGNIEAVKQHLDAGSEVNAKNDYGVTPLHYAAIGHKKIVELLIANGADVNVKHNWGRTPLHYAAFYGHKEIAELLIAEGADVNAKNDRRWTPLHGAAVEGHKEIAELLIAEGADVNAKTNDGKTPLDEVINPFYNKTEIADLLRKHGGKTGEELKAEGK